MTVHAFQQPRITGRSEASRYLEKLVDNGNQHVNISYFTSPIHHTTSQFYQNFAANNNHHYTINV
jgi:hypothetical protein